MAERTYRKHLHALSKSSKAFSRETLDKAVEKIRELRGVDKDTVLDLAVSFDRSWHKRDQTSKHGVALVIEMETGLVVDFHVMTTYCHACATTQAEKKTEDWQRQHMDICKINHQGSSGLMEVEAAKTMWSRSMERGLRYTTIISDGDSKTFTALTELKPYDVEVCKEECTNHVSKRLGTALRNLVSSESKKGTTLGGRKAGSLTKVKMGLLQSYYKKAVASRCSSVQELRAKIWSAFLHSSSTDNNPKHQECPKGSSSWCFWQRSIAFGKTPPSHKGRSSSFNSEHVANAIRPVYERLTTDDLLIRCLKGMTQNSNESIHSVIWARCPKHVFVGVDRVEIASALAVAQFNSGSRALRSFLDHAGCQASDLSLRKGLKRDSSRVEKAERKETVEAKRRRADIARAATAAQQEFLEVEGGRAYDSGAF